jgi:1-deoxy-D-xylulose-5-phosphate reductoisomerase
MVKATNSLVVLGSTGSIGVSTLDVISRHPDRFSVHALVAGKNIDLLYKQAVQHRPARLLICDPVALSTWHEKGFSRALQDHIGFEPQLDGADALDALCAAPQADTIVAAIVGAAGLRPTLSALKAGKRVLLANKESLVLAGQFMIDACKQSGAALLPVDSEHNAIYQCLPSNFDITRAHEFGIERLILTASGGPFRTKALAELTHVTPAQAVAHPNWVMGRKISVDSATMANKGLELIEALWLFGLPASNLSVLIHPQSIVHSMVEYKDASVLAQLGCPDMRTPIAHVLGLPDRIESGSPRLNLAQLARLDFEEPDLTRFPMLGLAFEALRKPDTLAPIFNAANEVAVDLFLNEKIAYMDIVRLTNACLERYANRVISCLDDAFALDEEVRLYAQAESRQFSR